jgi:PilZ domain
MAFASAPVKNQLVMATNSERRKERREFVKLPVRLNLAGEEQEHVGFVRDMSTHGMFFYSDLKPTLGSKIEFVMHLPKSGTLAEEIYCKATVVRVESHEPGTATGVALRIDASDPAPAAS